MKQALILLLAGSGSRLYSSIQVKKQFYRIQDQELFLYSLTSFVEAAIFDEIVLVVDDEDKEKVKEIVAKKFDSLPISYVVGGKDRNESVYHGLLALKDKEIDIVFIHDSARPLISNKVIMNLKEESEKYDALTVVLPMSDSILKEENGVITYLDRKDVYRILTPQVFSYPKILSIYLNGYDKEDTDDFKKAVKAGLKCSLVRGEAKGFKVTQEDDLELLESVIMK